MRGKSSAQGIALRAIGGYATLEIRLAIEISLDLAPPDRVKPFVYVGVQFVA